MKEGTRVLVGLGAGLGLGIAIAASHNDGLTRAADAVTPIGTLWVNAIRMTVIPLVVSLLITGVSSAADLRTVGRIGARTLLVFGAMLIGASLVIMRARDCGVLLVLACVPRPSGAAGWRRRGREPARHEHAADEFFDLAHVTHPDQPDRRGRQRRHAAAGDLRTAARTGHRQESRPDAYNVAGILSRAG